MALPAPEIGRMFVPELSRRLNIISQGVLAATYKSDIGLWNQQHAGTEEPRGIPVTQLHAQVGSGLTICDGYQGVIAFVTGLDFFVEFRS